MKKYLFTGLIALAILPGISFAQVSDTDTSATPSCAIISVNLRYLSRDVSTNGAVSVLQDFLQSHGYLNSQPTGFFGSMTRSAVSVFQKANGISATPPGFVGSVTRAKIQEVDCSGTVGGTAGTTTDSSAIRPTASITPPLPVNQSPIPLTPTYVPTSLSLTSPINNQTWNIGDTQTITWSYSGMANSLVGSVILRSTSGVRYTISNVPNTGSYTWSPVGTVNGMVIPSGMYIISVQMGNLTTESTGTLTIAPSANSMTAPTVTAYFSPSTVTIGTNSTNLIYNSTNATYCNFVQVGDSAHPVLNQPTSGSFPIGMFTNYGTLQEVVTCYNSAGQSSSATAAVTIAPVVTSLPVFSAPTTTPSGVPSVTVTYPNGGTVLTGSGSIRLLWQSANVDKVTIGYVTANGTLNWIATNIPNIGYYDWTGDVGALINPQLKIEIIGYHTGVDSTVVYSNLFTLGNKG